MPTHDLEGQTVEAMTYGLVSEDIEPRKVRGILRSRWLAGFQEFQCFVGDTIVDEKTIEPAAEEDEEAEPVHKAQTWDEDAHPRADDGRFGDKPGHHGGRHDEPVAPRGPKTTPPKTTTPAKGKAPPPDPAEEEELEQSVPESDREAMPAIKSTWAAVRDAVSVKIIELGIPLSYDIAPAVLDTADDWASGKAAAYGDQDAFHHATGISWSFTQTLVKHAIAAGFKAAGMIGGTAKADGMTPDILAAVCEIVCTALMAVEDELGVDLGIDYQHVRELAMKRLEG